MCNLCIKFYSMVSKPIQILTDIALVHFSLSNSLKLHASRRIFEFFTFSTISPYLCISSKMAKVFGPPECEFLAFKSNGANKMWYNMLAKCVFRAHSHSRIVDLDMALAFNRWIIVGAFDWRRLPLYTECRRKKRVQPPTALDTFLALVKRNVRVYSFASALGARRRREWQRAIGRPNEIFCFWRICGPKTTEKHSIVQNNRIASQFALHCYNQPSSQKCIRSPNTVSGPAGSVASL